MKKNKSPFLEERAMAITSTASSNAITIEEVHIACCFCNRYKTFSQCHAGKSKKDDKKYMFCNECTAYMKKHYEELAENFFYFENDLGFK